MTGLVPKISTLEQATSGLVYDDNGYFLKNFLDRVQKGGVEVFLSQHAKKHSNRKKITQVTSSFCEISLEPLGVAYSNDFKKDDKMNESTYGLSQGKWLVVQSSPRDRFVCLDIDDGALVTPLIKTIQMRCDCQSPVFFTKTPRGLHLYFSIPASLKGFQGRHMKLPINLGVRLEWLAGGCITIAGERYAFGCILPDGVSGDMLTPWQGHGEFLTPIPNHLQPTLPNTQSNYLFNGGGTEEVPFHQ